MEWLQLAMMLIGCASSVYLMCKGIKSVCLNILHGIIKQEIRRYKLDQAIQKRR